MYIEVLNVETGKTEVFHTQTSCAKKLGLDSTTLKYRLSIGPERAFSGFRFRTDKHKPFPKPAKGDWSCKIKIHSKTTGEQIVDSIHEVAQMFYRDVDDLKRLFRTNHMAELGLVTLEKVYA